MAAKKYVTYIGNRLKRIAATVISLGGASAGDLVALDDTGHLHLSVLPTGVGAETTSAVAFENIASGKFVYIGSDGQVRLADASAEGKEAGGFVLVGGDAATTVLVYHIGINTQLSGLTPNTRYYLSSTVPGGFTDSVPDTAAVAQYLGRAASSTSIPFEQDPGILL